MECMQERPRSRHRIRNTEREETENDALEQESETDDTQGDGLVDGNSQGYDNVSTSNSVKEINDSDMRKLNELNTLLSEQEEVFKTEQEGIEMKTQTTKERVSNLFAHFREILAEKENELLDKIDSEFTIAGNFITDFVGNIESEKQKVSALLDNNRLSDNVGQEDIEQIKEDIDVSLDIRNDILNQFRIPYLVLNEVSIDTIKDLSFGEFQESSTEVTPQNEPGHGNQEDYVSENSQETVNDENAEHIDIVAGINASSENDETHTRGSALAEGVINELCNEKEAEVQGATGITGEDVRLPTAPPAEPEESPPPYWQAMGLEEPQSESQSQAEIPGYYDIPHSPNNRLPENKLQLWHSFPIRRQYDRRGPMPVGLTWNHGRICVADRANMRVKFFFPNGQQITELHFSGIELHDVAFLEESQGESRYALTSPKSRTLLIISIDSQNIPKVIRKLMFRQQYSCVCRGPIVQTLLAAEVATNYGAPVVNLFTFTGQILLSIKHTPTFAFLKYIKSVDVFGNNIIVLDYKLNSVSVFQDDGRTVGEYRGTQTSPLINPLDITLDNKGNIMILNGEFSNVHVIDLHCNPVEIIKIPRNVSSTSASSKLIAFDTGTHRLSVARSNGDIAVFTFENGYDCLPQRNLAPNIMLAPSPQNSSSCRQRAPQVLPLVEGMLPSTIEDIITRQPARNRNRQFHL